MQKSGRVDEVALSLLFFFLSISIRLPFLFFRVWGAIVLYDIFYPMLTFVCVLQNMNHNLCMI